MRFSIKIFLCTVVAVAISFAAGGYLLISSNFAVTKDREISAALDEHLSLQYMLESAIITQQLQGQKITDEAIRDAAQDIETGLQKKQQGGKNLLLYDSNGKEIYPAAKKSTLNFKKANSLLQGKVVYNINRNKNTYTLTVTSLFTYASKRVYLSYMKDITPIFMQQESQIHAFMLYQGGNILMSGALAFMVAWLLTRPIRKLTQISRKISIGNYDERTDIRTSDEIGELAISFNIMASSVEDKINQLKQASLNKDDFIANFTHELKTPMTSIIGYADMLRSKQLDPATTFKAAQYIYTESNRLEALSLKMLDLIMLEKNKFEFVPVSCTKLLDYISKVVTPSFEQDDIRLTISAQDGFINAEQDLIKTLLINIVDNARKASASRSTVELLGLADGNCYTFSVTDHGRGIPKDELGNITEAFYMIDKSRSRAQNGVGLGLAISSRIASLHHTELKFQSSVGIGTIVAFTMPCCNVSENEYEE